MRSSHSGSEQEGYLGAEIVERGVRMLPCVYECIADCRTLLAFLAIKKEEWERVTA